MEFWISRWALSGGISKKECGKPTDDGYVMLSEAWAYLKLGCDAHESFEEARAAAEKMRLKRIASLKKQIARLEGLDFSEETS